jgi:hypothetical protein
LNRRHLRIASVRAYIAAMDLKFWQKALREAERELDAATTRTALDAAAKKLMRAKAELKRAQAEVSA